VRDIVFLFLITKKGTKQREIATFVPGYSRAGLSSLGVPSCSSEQAIQFAPQDKCVGGGDLGGSTTILQIAFLVKSPRKMQLSLHY